MADIPIQQKEGRSILPWIIGLIVLAVLLWFLFMRRTPAVTAPGVTDTTTTMTTPRTDSVPAGAPVGSTTTMPPR
jgi:ABC-type transporter Mla subunit MlaD